MMKIYRLPHSHDKVACLINQLRHEVEATGWEIIFLEIFHFKLVVSLFEVTLIPPKCLDCSSQVSVIKTKQFLKSLHLRWEICQLKRKETELQTTKARLTTYDDDDDDVSINCLSLARLCPSLERKLIKFSKKMLIFFISSD